MAEPAGCHILAVMGSGETSPTMVTVHRALVARLGLSRPRAALLETPYRFQENADDISARAVAYFDRSVGLEVSVLAGMRPAGDGGGDGDWAGSGDSGGVEGGAGDGGAGDGGAGVVRAADWVFSGPGSPTFALAQWTGTPLAGALRDRLLAGQGITVFASAAAVTLGLAALPVYEIYKVGAAPCWLDGLDLMSALGLKVAVIPHYDNAEGGNHDTRYCYLGERRLSRLERELPDDAAVLGVDEHTVAVFDLDAGSVEISGRGGVTVRRRGASTVLPPGTTITLAQLQDLVSQDKPWSGAPAGADGPGVGGPAEPGAAAGRSAPDTLPDITAAAERRFEAAERDRDSGAMVAAILDLDTAIHDWAADTEEDQGTEQSRAVLRNLITRLGQAAQRGLGDPRECLAPAAERLIALRAELRDGGSYQTADAIRDALAAAGLQLRDGTEGTDWELEPRPG